MAGRRKDIFPQFMSFSVAQAADNVYRDDRIQLPVARTPGAAKITVIEVLSVSVDFEAPQALAADGQNFQAFLSFRSNGAVKPQFSDPNLWFQYRTEFQVVTSGGVTVQLPWTFRYDTGGGRGFLIATDSIFAGTQNLTGAATTRAHFKVLYRFVQVGLQEYIGIVQQQSAQT